MAGIAGRCLNPAVQGSNIDQMAETERAGFEPAMEFDPHTRLAGECLQPLGHLSASARKGQCKASGVIRAGLSIGVHPGLGAAGKTEGEGFEPSGRGLPAQWLSRPPHSTALPPLQGDLARLVDHPRGWIAEPRLRMFAVQRIAPINRVLSRHRRTTALVGAIVVLGVGALDAHAALPEHHHEHGKVTVCIAALAIAGLAALGWCKQGTPQAPRLAQVAPLLQAASSLATDTPRTSARAGPSRLTVLRL